MTAGVTPRPAKCPHQTHGVAVALPGRQPVAERLRAWRLHRLCPDVAQLHRNNPLRRHVIEIGDLLSGARPVPAVDDEARVRHSLHDPPGRREVGDAAVGHELERDGQIRARALTKSGELLSHDVKRKLFQQPGVEMPHAEGARHVEDGSLLGLLCLVAVGCGAPPGEVLDFGDPHPVLLGDGQHRGVIEAGGPVILGA